VATWSGSISTSATIPAASSQSKEVRDRPVIGHAGVLVADGGGEEFQEAADRGVAGTGDRRRHGEPAAPMTIHADGQCRVGFLAGSEASISRRARLHERTTACISCSAIRVISFMC
jgi:hypothetical protein